MWCGLCVCVSDWLCVFSLCVRGLYLSVVLVVFGVVCLVLCSVCLVFVWVGFVFVMRQLCVPCVCVCVIV